MLGLSRYFSWSNSPFPPRPLAGLQEWRTCARAARRRRAVQWRPGEPSKEERVPTYEYRCTACELRFERVQKFADEPVSICPECGGEVKKVFGSVGIVLKGSGFYKTDSRSSSSASTPPSSSPASSGSDSASPASPSVAPSTPSASPSKEKPAS